MIKKGLGRRSFLKFSMLAGGLVTIKGTALAGMMGGGGCGGGGSGSTIINPPPGSSLIEPVNISKPSLARTMEVDLWAMKQKLNINGVSTEMLTYNGHYPGPVIRVNKDDTDILRVNFTNSLARPTDPVTTNILGFTKNVTNIHTHGWHVSPMEPGDNSMREFLPGQTTDGNPYPPYQYDLRLQPAGTLSFYHPHMHGRVAEQVWGGLLGTLVVEDPPEVRPILSGIETHLLVLKDITVSNGVPEPYTSTMEYMHGKEGDTVMVNGQVNPVLNARPGQVQRWRILNASQARFYKLNLANHSMQVIGTDGGLLDKPYPQSYILLSPGERIDVLVKVNSTPGIYKFLSLPYSRMGMMTSAQITLMTLSVSGSRVNDMLPASIDTTARRIQNVPISGQKTITLSMMRGRGYINDYDFDTKPYVGSSDLGTYEIWTIVNQCNMDHNWHQHTNEGQVLSISGGDAAYTKLYTQSPALKDVVLIPKMGTVKILMPVMDYCGMAMFHCHILEHEDIGMIAIWQIGDMPPMPM